MIMYGSSIFMINIVNRFVPDKRLWASPFLFKGTYTIAAGMSTAGTVGEVPREPIRGGTLPFEDAVTLARYVVVGDEVRKADKLASLDVNITEKGHRLAATPFEDAGDGRLRCAITNVVVRPATD